MAIPVRELAPAKINLSLRVNRLRADGFHELCSLVAFTDIGDELLLEAADEISLGIGGRFGAALAGGSADNLVVRAAAKFFESYDTGGGVRIELVKNLPVASGIGGGSADAAATLRGLCQLYGQADEGPVIKDIAALLGSDVAVCLRAKAAIIRGRGEQVSAVADFPKLHVVLVNPGVELASKDVFARYDGGASDAQAPPPDRFATLRALIDYLRDQPNDLEPAACALCPEIRPVLAALAGCAGVLLARMSGSGASCFGLFDTGCLAEQAAQQLMQAHPGWWVQPARLA